MDPPAHKATTESFGKEKRRSKGKRRTKRTYGHGAGEQRAEPSHSGGEGDGRNIRRVELNEGGRIGGQSERRRGASSYEGSPAVSSALTHYLAGHGAPPASYNKHASSTVSSAMYSGLMTEDGIWLAEAGAVLSAKPRALGTIESEEAMPTQEPVPRRRMLRRSSSHNDVEAMMAMISEVESQTPTDNPDISTRSEPPALARFPRRTSDDWNNLIALKLKAKELKQEKMKAKELTPLGTVEMKGAKIDRNRIVFPGDNAADVTGANSAPKTAPGIFGDDEEISESKHRQKKKLVLLLMALVLLLVLIFGVVFGLRGDNSSDNAATVDAVGGGTSKGNADGSSKPMAPVSQPSFPATSSPVDGDLLLEAVEINKPASPPSPMEDLKPSTSPVVFYAEKVHIVEMLLKNVDDQFSLSAPYVNSILRYITTFVNKCLEEPYELRGVGLEEGVRELMAPPSNIRRRRRLQTFTIPLRITIFGPAGLHMKSIVELFLDTTDIRNYLKTISYAFREVTVSVSDFLDEQEMATGCPVNSMPDGLAPPVVPPVDSPLAPPTSSPSAISNVPPATPVLDPPTASPSTENPIPIPTDRPTSKPSYKTFPTCSQDLIFCENGASVFRNPLNDCEFFPCPGGSKPIGDTSVSTSEPSPPTDGSTLAPSDPPVTTLPTPSPTSSRGTTSSLSPTVRTTTKALSGVPTEVPTFKSTSTTSVLCTSLGNGQCDAPLSISSKCMSSDTIANDNYGHAVALTTRSNGEVFAVVGSR